jgi:hypothetical protein
MAIDLYNHKHLFNVENDTELQELKNQLTEDNKPTVIYNKETYAIEYLPKWYYTIDLNGQWRLSTNIPNPNSDIYDGVYESYLNHNVDESADKMIITIKDYSKFSLYIRSYAESSYDYIMVSQLNASINKDTDYDNITLVKAHTCDNQQFNTALSNYTLVEFTNIPTGQHTIEIIYRKDSSSHHGDDRGYVLIPKNQ